MKIIIDIPEKAYSYIKREWVENDFDSPMNHAMNGIKNGTPLPKKHGKLIILSEDAVKRSLTSFSFSCQNWISEVSLSNSTVAIIKADGGDTE